jgi:hypothetical protein
LPLLPLLPLLMLLPPPAPLTAGAAAANAGKSQNSTRDDDARAADVVSIVLAAYPEAANKVDGGGRLPLHLAAAFGLSAYLSNEFASLAIKTPSLFKITKTGSGQQKKGRSNGTVSHAGQAQRSMW